MTIGNFDGVHLGHRAILAKARELASAHHVPVKVLTFDPHPASVLRPGQEPLRLTPMNRKRDLLREAGADEVIVIEPTHEMLAMEPVPFMSKLVAEHQPAAIVEGIDFRFGRGRSADVNTLAQLGKRLGFTTHIVPDEQVTLSDHLIAPVSSSFVRWLLSHGRVADAARALGRAHEIAGLVVQGDQRGRTLNIPTANLDAAALTHHALPLDGVYAGSATLADGGTHVAAISIGIKPTFAGRVRTIEAHLLDFQGDLYGQRIVLELHRWLREQQSFPSVDLLKAQLSRDLTKVRELSTLGLLKRTA